jgi:hypothetical protein
MSIFLFILCLLSFLAGLMIFAGAKSAIHEIEAFLLFLIGAVFLVGAAIVDYLKQMLKSQQKAEEHLRVLRSTHEEQTKREHVKSSPPPLAARQVVADQTYHYIAEGEQIGPYTSRDIREFRDAGVIANDTLLLKDGDTQWRPLSEFAELTSLAHGTKET